MEADEKKCPQCAETVKAEAKICRFCAYSFENDVSPNPGKLPLPNKAKEREKGCLIVLGIVVVLGIIGSLVSPGKKTTSLSNVAASENLIMNTNVTSHALADTNKMLSSTNKSETTSDIELFGPQANAARNAQQYLSMTGFSRRGLIEQLSSDAGNGYSVVDATAAVDSLTVDWNEQAMRSARQYIDMTGFSCSGLIKQLSSDAGSKYTKAQARYGAEQAGAC